MTLSVLVLICTLSFACTMLPLDDTFEFRTVDEGFTVMVVGRMATSFFWAEADFGWRADRSGARGAHGGRVGAAFCAAKYLGGDARRCWRLRRAGHDDRCHRWFRTRRRRPRRGQPVGVRDRRSDRGGRLWKSVDASGESTESCSSAQQ